MCVTIKNMETMRSRYNTAIENNIYIIEIEFSDDRLEYRDRWSIKKILNKYEQAIKKMKKHNNKNEFVDFNNRFLKRKS